MNNPKIDNFVCCGISCRYCVVCSTDLENHIAHQQLIPKHGHISRFPQFAGLDIFSMQRRFQEIQTVCDVHKKWFSVDFLDLLDMKMGVILCNRYQRIRLLQLRVYSQHLLHNAVLVRMTICRRNLDEISTSLVIRN